VVSSPTVNRINNAIASVESSNNYTVINNKTKDGKLKPADQWAIGKYQHYYKYNKNDIKQSLQDIGINVTNKSDEEIANLYANNAQAQEVVQNKLTSKNVTTAGKLIDQFKINASVEEITDLVHFLGPKGAEQYISLFKQYGQAKADEIMAYGDSNHPYVRPVGGPDSTVPNPFVSSRIFNFKEKLKTVPAETTPKQPKTNYQPQVLAPKPQLNPNPTFRASPYPINKNPKSNTPAQPKKVVTETKDPSFLEKAWTYMFESDVPIEETRKVKDAADGNPTEDQEFVRNTNESSLLKKSTSLPPTKKSTEDPKIKQRKIEDDNFTKTIGYSKVNEKVYRGKSYKNLNLGSYSKLMVDMSEGITVTYQPRNDKKDKRKEVNNAVAISDYLYDFDFTDNVYDVQANAQIENLKYRWKSKDYKDQPFVQVKENLGNGKFKVKIKAVKDLTQNDFNENKIYRQSYAKLSDFDITPDQKKIKLKTYKNSFVNQGIPFRDAKNQEHTLRISGGKNNHSKYQNISELNQFGPYLGGTVTIISEDGKVAKKVSGSVKDILETAFHIKKQTGSKEIYFLQSDAGSMNIKADANNGKITPAQLAIARNQEPQAGAAEILLNE
jgi:hypothetical protein